MHELQSLLAAERCRRHAELLEVVQNVQLDAFQPLLGDAIVLRLDTECDVARFLEAVVALGELGLQYLGVFAPNLVEIVAPRRNDDTLLQRVVPAVEIVERELEPNRRIEVVQKVAPTLEDSRLVVVLSEMVVDVLKANGLGVERVAYAANAIRPHPLIGDAVLRGRGLLFSAPRARRTAASISLRSRLVRDRAVVFLCNVLHLPI